MALDSGGHLTHGFRPNVSGQALPLLQLRRRSRDRAGSTTSEVRRRAREERPLLDHRRLQLVPATRRLPDLPRDRRRGRRDADGRHGALRGPGRRTRAHGRRGSRRARAHRDHDDAQDLARSARRAGALREGARRDRSTAAVRWCSADRCRTCIAAKAVALHGGRAAGVPRLRAARRRQRADARRGAASRRRVRS